MSIIQLKRPDGSAVYVNSSAVQSFAEVPAAEIASGHVGGTRLSFGGGHQDVQETPEAVATMIAAASAAQSMTIVPTAKLTAESAANLTLDTMKSFAREAGQFQSAWPGSMEWAAPDPTRPGTKTRPAGSSAGGTGNFAGIAGDPTHGGVKTR